MSDTQIISDKHDFPHVTVTRTDTAAGPIFRIGFKNREPRPELQMLPGVLLGLIGGSISAWGEFTGNLSGEVTMPLLMGSLVLFFGSAIWTISMPYHPRRLIELDYPAKIFRMKRNGKVTVEKPLDRLHGLAVEPHPDAEYKRHKRMDRGERALSKEEKMHCLVGYFGYQGAERVDLVCRLEWPDKNSLIEVQRAIFFANEKAGGAPVAEEEVIHGEGGMVMRGMKPPLD